jgi:hypothetical protein
VINHESKVALTYNIGGALLSTRAKNDKNETVPLMRYSKCQVRLILDSTFVRNSTHIKDGRPDRSRYPAAYGRWFKMSLRERLEWHLHNLVASRDGGGMKYELV